MMGLHLCYLFCTSVFSMTSKQPKKSNKKKAPVKKASAKKAPAKKAPAKKAPAKEASGLKTKGLVAAKDPYLLAKVGETKEQFANAEKFMKVMAEQTAVIRVNDVKSLPLRKKMLAWFKISK